jgi:hypothetical protein
MNYLALEYPIEPFMYRGVSYSSIFHFYNAMLFSTDDPIRKKISISNINEVKQIIYLNTNNIINGNDNVRLQSLTYGLLVKYSQPFFGDKIVLENKNIFDNYSYSLLLKEIQFKLNNEINLMEKIGKFHFDENNIKTTVINRHHRNIRGAVYIGRGTPFGNTNSSMDVGSISREESIARYKYDFYNKIKFDPIFKLKILNLKGKILSCSCKPLLCHGDIIREYLDNLKNYKKEYMYTLKMIERLNKA